MSRHKFNFPMLKLPFPMIEKTIRKLSASDVFHFSLISPEHLERIRSMRGHALAGAEIKLAVKRPEEMEIHFTPVDANVDPFAILVKNIKKATPQIMKNKKFAQEINGFPIKITLYRNKTIVYVPSGFDSKIALINYCFENLQCQGISLTFEISTCQISIYQPMIDIFKQCQDLKIICSAAPSIDMANNMERFLSGVQVSRNFQLNQPPLLPLNLPPSVLSAKKLYILPLIVSMRETLLSINCECACFYNTYVTSEDLSEFVVKWFNSDGTRFKRLKVGTPNPFRQLDLSMIPEQNIEHMDEYNIKITRTDGTFAVMYLERYLFDLRVSNEEVEFK